MNPSVVVGVHIAASCIRVAVVANSRLVLHKKHSLPEGVHVADAGFAPVLRSALDEACAGHGRPEIWAAASFPNTSLHHVRIPKVTAAQFVGAVRWALNKEQAFDETTTILDMDIEGEVVEEGTSKLAVSAYTVPRQAVHELKNIFRAVGHPVTGITLPFFGLRNLFKSRRIAPSNKAVLHMHVGSDYSRISIFAKGEVVLVREIKTGFNALLDAICENAAAPTSPAQACDLLDELDAEPASQSSESAPGGEEVLKVIHAVLIRIVRQIEQTIASPLARESLGDDRTFYISGEICRHRRIVEFINELIGIPIQILNPLKSGQESPTASDIEAVVFSHAVGLALSNVSRTPNALHTLEERFLLKRSDRVLRVGLVVLGVLVLGMFGTAQVMNIVAKRRSADVADLRAKLAATGPALSMEMLSNIADRSDAQRKKMEALMQKTAAVSVLGELSRLTPGQIQLTEAELDMAPPETVRTTQSAATTKGQAGVLVIKGRVRSGWESSDSIVAGYAVELETSPIFDEVAVQDRDTKADASDGSRFVLKVILANPKPNSGRY